MSTLATIQSKIKAEKSQYNSFGKYNYRSCEDIVEAAKPVLLEHGFALNLTDEIIMLGDRYYVKAVASITNGTETYSATGYAREEQDKKGMDGSQITGAASSYARKYALNGLLAIDDTKDSDATNDHGKTTPPINNSNATDPHCKKCNGTTHYQETKTGKGMWVCNQDNGACMTQGKDGKMYKTVEWVK